jgi:hypothetical protein
MRGTSLTYPDRKRCYVCHQYFGFIVVWGLYCSYECAGMPPPSRYPEEWPREHFSARGGQREEKRAFLSPREAREFVQSWAPDKEPYECGHCGMWHIGGKPRRPSINEWS